MTISNSIKGEEAQQSKLTIRYCDLEFQLIFLEDKAPEQYLSFLLATSTFPGTLQSKQEGEKCTTAIIITVLSVQGVMSVCYPLSLYLLFCCLFRTQQFWSKFWISAPPYSHRRGDLNCPKKFLREAYQTDKAEKLLEIGHWHWKVESAKKAGINVDFLNLSHKIILPVLSSSLSTLSWVNDPTAADPELKSPGQSFICISLIDTSF